MFDQALRSVHAESTQEECYLGLRPDPMDVYDSYLHGSAMNEIGYMYKHPNIDQVNGFASDHELSWI